MKQIKVISMAIAMAFSGISYAQEIQAPNAQVHTQKAEVLTSVQLWSVRKDLKKDFKGTLQKIADMGFDGVEFARDFGPYKNDPQGLKEFLDSLGLKASGGHLGFKPFRTQFFKTVAFYKTLGVDTLIVPMDKRSFNPDKFDEFTKELNELSVKLARYGIKTGYHNHWQEFESYKQSTFWDHIGQDTNDNVVLQLDVGWLTYINQDSVEYVNKFPGRTFTTHLKPKLEKNYAGKAEANGHYPIIGRDNFDWKSVIEAQMNIGGTKWFVVEQEEYPLGMTPLEAVQASKVGFDKVLESIR